MRVEEGTKEKMRTTMNPHFIRRDLFQQSKTSQYHAVQSSTFVYTRHIELETEDKSTLLLARSWLFTYRIEFPNLSTIANVAYLVCK